MATQRLHGKLYQIHDMYSPEIWANDYVIQTMPAIRGESI
jgi:hypothetical protein